MIILSFLSAVACYRKYLHIGVGVLPAFLAEPAKSYLGRFLEACMLVTNVFMFWWGSSWSRRRGTRAFPSSRRSEWDVLFADSRRWSFDFAVRHRARHDAKILFRART